MTRAVRGAVAATALCGLAGIAALQPMSAAAATQQPSATASASALSLSLNPSALLSLPAPVVSALNALPSTPLLPSSDILKGLTGEITASVAGVNSRGTATSTGGDLATGHADNTIVSVNNAALATVLSTLKTALGGALLPTQLTSVQGAGPALTTLLSTLAGVTNPLTSAIGGDGNLAQAISVDLPPAGRNAFGNPSLPLLGTSVSSSLVTAVNKATAAPLAVGPQAEAHQTAANLAELQSISLSGLADGSVITNALNELNASLAPLNTAVTALNAANLLPTAAAIPAAITALNTLKAAVPTLATVIDPVISALNGGASVSSAITTVTGLVTQVTNAVNAIPGVQTLLGALPNISLGSLFSTTGVAASSLVEPQSTGIHTRSVSGITDIAVGKLASGVAAPLPALAALLEVKNIGSSAEAFVNGTDTTAPTGTVGIGEIDVLGQKVLDGATLPQGQTLTKTVSLPNLGILTLVINAGKPVLVNNSATRKTVQSSAVDIQLLNGDAAGANGIGLLGATGHRLVDLNMASSAVDASNTALGTSAQTPSALPPTGMFGPAAFGAGAALGLLGVGLGVGTARRRRSQS